MDPYGPVWVRMVPEDSLGASWGLLGPWGSKKAGIINGVLTPRGPGGASWVASLCGLIGLLLAYVGSY